MFPCSPIWTISTQISCLCLGVGQQLDIFYVPLRDTNVLFCFLLIDWVVKVHVNFLPFFLRFSAYIDVAVNSGGVKRL